MEILWDHGDRYLTARQVADGLDDGLAYTTVTTLLTRLAGKGLLSRRRRGRALVYRPRLSRSEYAALAMLSALDEADDQPGVLLTFVGELSPDQQAAVRAVLEDPRK